MIDKDRQKLRERMRFRVLAHTETATQATTDLTDTLADYSDLNPRARDFAFHYAVSPARSAKKWAVYFGLNENTIWSYLAHKRVKELIEDLRYDVRKYMVAMQQSLIKDAMMQYKDIFDTPIIDGPMMEAKRKAAKEVLAWQGIGSDLDEEGNTRSRPVNINVGGGALGSSNGGPSFAPAEITLDDIKGDVVNLEKKQKLRMLAEKYGKNREEIES